MKNKYNPNYHNNKFNFLISKMFDERRTIMDFDTFISAGNKIAFLIDHKQEDLHGMILASIFLKI